MINTDNINLFFTHYKKNFQLFCSWNDKIYQRAEPAEWINSLKKRAFLLSNIYLENCSLINEYLMPLIQSPNSLSDDDYDLLFDWTRDMYLGNYDDPFMIRLLARFLLPHYEEPFDIEHIPFIYLALGYANIEISRTGDREAGVASVFYYKKLTALHEYFDRFTNEYNRTYIFTAYCNLITVEDSLGNLDWRECYDLYQELADLRSQEKYCRFDLQNPRLAQLANTTLSSYSKEALNRLYEFNEMYWHESLPLTEDPRFCRVQEISRSFYRNLLSQAPDYPGYTREQAYMGFDFLCKEGVLTADEAWQMADTLYNRRTEEASQIEIDPIGVHVNPLTRLFGLLYHTDYPGEFKSRYAAKYRRNLQDFLRSYPSGINSYTLNSCLGLLCQNPKILSFLPTARERENYILELMVARHLTTYIHSTIVSLLAATITDAVCDCCPQLLTGLNVPGRFRIDSPEELADHREALIDYVHRSALLHDIGKNSIVDVINAEYRPLSDDEFTVIKRHPQLGVTILSVDESFACYHDIVMGHHRYYDGSAGYPEEYNPLTSPVRLLVDIISICDTLDAATDRLGRNYHIAKTFDQILQELENGAGTRYNPDIVALIHEQTALCLQIEEILTVEREQVYYDVYHKYFANTDASSDSHSEPAGTL